MNILYLFVNYFFKLLQNLIFDSETDETHAKTGGGVDYSAQQQHATSSDRQIYGELRWI